MQRVNCLHLVCAPISFLHVWFYFNSENVCLTTLYNFCFLFPQFLQNQGFVASISSENEIQVLILLGPFKFLVNYFFHLQDLIRVFTIFIEFLVTLILLSFLYFILPISPHSVTDID
jgi:hypothetical protein